MSKLQKTSWIATGLFLFIFFLYKPLGLIRIPLFQVSAYEAIPANTAVLLEGQLAQLSEAKGTLNELVDKDVIYRQFKKDLRFVKAIFTKEEEDRKQIYEQGRLVSGVQLNGLNDIGFLHVLDRYDGKFDVKQFLEQLKVKKLSTSVYRGEELHRLTFANDETFVICQFRNLILMGRLALQVEDGIEQLKKPYESLMQDWGFRKLLWKAEEDKVKCYINFKGLPDLLSPLMESENRSMLAALPQLGRWLQLELQVEEGCLRSKGRFLPAKNNSLFKSLKKVKTPAASSSIANVLPDNTGFACSFSIGDAKHFFPQSQPQSDSDFQKYFLPWLGEEMAYVITEPYSSTFEDERFILLKLKDEALAEHYLEKYTQVTGQLEEFPYHNRIIRRLMSSDLFLPAFGTHLNHIQNPYYTIVEDYVLFCNSRQALEISLDKYLAGQTLARNVAYLQSITTLSNPSGLNIYISPTNIQSLLRSFFKAPLRRGIDQAFVNYKKAGDLQLQLLDDNTIDACLQFTPAKIEKAKVMWKVALKAPASMAPALVRNPAKEEYEIFVQDELNRIYLLSRGGDQLWSRQLDAPLISTVYQIDYYENGDLQFLFNTSNGIYLIDQEGNDISAYPISFQSKATNGLLLVDFGNRNEYGFFVACENGNLYGFERTGRPLTGWNPKRGVGEVKHPMQHFEEKGKDYLMALNEEGRLYVFSRDGQRRFNPKSFHASFISSFDFQNHLQSARIVATDQSGRARVVNTSGGSIDFRLDVGSNEKVRFAYADIGGDEAKDYVVMSGQELAAYTNKGKQLKKLFTRRFDNEQDELFGIDNPAGGKQWIGTLNAKLQQINLLDANGELLPDFPLAGTTGFQVAHLFNDGKSILVVAKGEDVYAYQLR